MLAGTNRMLWAVHLPLEFETLSTFDFTIGDEDFKRKFGTTATPICGYYRAGSLLGRVVKSVFERKHAYDINRSQRKER